MSKSAVTFRLRRVPATITRQHLARFLQESVPDLGEADNIHIRSLARSPDDWNDPSCQTATLEFDHVPELLQNKSRTTWEWPIPGSNHPLICDTHFLGFTPLNSVDEHNHEFDLIAVSGLASHPFGSWRQRRSLDQQQFMWLRDQLPGDFPALRCMIYGYDTKLVGSDSFQSIDDLARSFISHLKYIGRAEYSARPLIILGHSLGGILVKRALLFLAGAGEIDLNMLSKIKLFIAFGVPNRGMRIDHLLAVVGSQPNKDLVKTLSEEQANMSSWLSLLDQSFYGIAQHRDIRTVSAYETRKTPLTEMQSTGEAQRTGAAEIVVQRESAIQRGSRDPQDIFPINKDHSNMVKFERDDTDYFVVRDFLRDTMVTLGEEQVASHNKRGKLVPELVSQRHNTLSTRELAGANVVEPPESGFLADIRPSRQDKETSTSLLVRSLEFHEQSYRLKAIEQAHESTFGWIFEKAELGLIPWIMKGTGVYWIRGKPGSGKSTLMRYLHDSGDLREALRARSVQKRLIDSWFFFNERGSHLQKSLDGLLRTILADLVSKDNTIASLVLKVYESKPEKVRDRWRFEDLKEAFAAILSQPLYDLELTIFLDALDEYYGFPATIAEWILNVITASQDPDHRTKVRFFFSSRQWDSFMKAFDQQPGFVLHEHTKQDIKQYIISKFSQLSPQHSSTLEAQRTSLQQTLPAWLINTIQARAEGVFLWVKLAMDEIAFSGSDLSQQDLETLINKLPADLEEFYIRTISRIPQHSRWKAYTLLEIVSRNPKLLSPEDLFYASECAQGSTFPECQKLFAEAQARLKRAPGQQERTSIELLNFCGGLLECVQHQPVVQLIHRTLRDFVLSPQFPGVILGRGFNLQIDNGFTFSLKYYCVLRNQNHDTNPDLELLGLAHLDESSIGRPATVFIDSLPSEFFRASEPTVENTSMADYYTSPFIFAVLAGLYLYVRDRLAAPDADQTKVTESLAPNKLAWLAMHLNDEFIPLLHPPLDGLPKMMQYLLRHGFSANTEYFGLTPFETFFCDMMSYRYSSVGGRIVPKHVAETARVLIVDGKQDPNRMVRYVRYRKLNRMVMYVRYRKLNRMYYSWREKFSCDSCALHVSDLEMKRILLQSGADPNVQDSRGNTALDLLVGSYGSMDSFVWNPTYEEAMLLLLSHGGRLTRRGKKFLDLMQKSGYGFPEELVSQDPLDVDVPTWDIPLIKLSNHPKMSRPAGVLIDLVLSCCYRMARNLG